MMYHSPSLSSSFSSTHLSLLISILTHLSLSFSLQINKLKNPGSFKDTTGDTVCSLCPAGSYMLSTQVFATTTAASCIVCSADPAYASPSSISGLVSTSTQSNCICNIRYGRTSNALPCVACPIGTYKDVTGDFPCSPCPVRK